MHPSQWGVTGQLRLRYFNFVLVAEHRSNNEKGQSASCAAGLQRCSCDEYLFASTWNGERIRPDNTSAKLINHRHNLHGGGAKISNFYSKERVLDLTTYPTPFGFETVVQGEGDDFWVHVK